MKKETVPGFLTFLDEEYNLVREEKCTFTKEGSTYTFNGNFPKYSRSEKYIRFAVMTGEETGQLKLVKTTEDRA